MAIWSDSARAALNPEEAALLPALPRIRGAGAAALRSALRAAEAMGEMQLSNLVSTSDPPIDQGQPALDATQDEALVYRGSGSRAALHHVLRR